MKDHVKLPKQDVESKGKRILPEKATKGPDKCKQPVWRTGKHG